VIDPQILARIDAIEPTPFAGKAFRHLAPDHHPLSGIGARTHGGRWNPPDSFSTLYLALERKTTVLEFGVYRELRDNETITLERLRKDKVQAVSSLDEDQLKGQWRVYQCIVYEVEHDGHLYVLSGGDWYQAGWGVPLAPARPGAVAGRLGRPLTVRPRRG
jgi:hypothetical protein